MTLPVEVHELRKTYPNGVEALKGVSFEVEEGELFGLLGPNGAGKTTTVGILTTTVRPSGGRALVAGHDVARDALAVRRAIGVAFQDSVLDNDFSGLENLRLHARLWRMPGDEAATRISALLDRVDLAKRARDGVRTYSGGMRRRLELARALLAKPKVVFLDEPTVGLDPAVRHELWHLVQELRETEGVTTVLTTHYLEEAEGVCDRVAVIHQGQIAAIGTPARLIEELGSDVIELGVEHDPREAARVLADSGLGTRGPLVVGRTVALPVHREPDDLAGLLHDLQSNGAGVTATSVRRTTLNDVFLHLTGAAEPAA